MIDHYLKVVSDKTGSLIATSARFGALLSGADSATVETLTKFGEKVGIAFQIADDLLDVQSDSTESGKTPGTDLKEGVPTLVTLYVMASTDPADKDLAERLSKAIPESEISKTILELREHKAVREVKEYLNQIADEANQLLAQLPSGVAKDALGNLITALISRSA
jgi:heptaprenyl diphosphate synthase